MKREPVPLDKSRDYLSKLNEVKIVLVSIIFGIVIATFSGLLLSPLKIDVIKVYENNSLVNVTYAGKSYGTIYSNQYIILIALSFVIISYYAFKFLRKNIQQIPEYVDYALDLDPYVRTKKISEFVNYVHLNLKNIISDFGLDEELKVYKKLEREDKFLVYVGTSKDYSEATLKIEFRTGVIIFYWKTDDNILKILDKLNEKIVTYILPDI